MSVSPATDRLARAAARSALEQSVRAVVVFRNDDPSAASDVAHERRIAAIFERYAAPQVLAIIPNCAAEGFRDPRGTRNVPLADNPEMCAFLSDYARRSRSEIALHGFTHRTNRLSNPARREYFEFRGVGRAQQAEWIAQGIGMIDRALGIRPRTFVPPWNRLDGDTLWACVENGCTIVSAADYTPEIPGIASLGTNCCLADVPRLMREIPVAARRVFVRVLFHSRTTRSEAELVELESAVRAAAETPGVRITTLAEMVADYPDEIALANAAGRNTVDPTELWGTIRARAEVYRRTLVAVRGIRESESPRAQAANACARGDYQAALALTPIIDRAARRTLGAGRILALALGAALGASLAALWARGPWTPTLPILIGVELLISAAMLATGFGAALRATAPDTRSEIRCAAVLAAIGAILGATFTAWVASS